MIRASALLLVALAACRTQPGPSAVASCPEPALYPTAPPSIETDARTYTARHDGGEGPHARYSFDLVARFTNPLPDTVYLGRERPDSPHPIYGLGRSAYNGAVLGSAHSRQFAVAPGATRTDTLHVTGPMTWDGVTGEPDGPLDGPMRLSYEAYGCRGEAARLAVGVAVSDTFVVRLE